MSETNATGASLRPILISLGIVAYFVVLLLVDYFRIDFFLVGVLVELLTIPTLLALVLYGGYNLWMGFRAGKGQRFVHWIAVGILFGGMAMLVWMSF